MKKAFYMKGDQLFHQDDRRKNMNEVVLWKNLRKRNYKQ